MKIGHIDFPPELLRALRDGNLVIFAGTGVSMGDPALLPSFKKLADEIAEGSGLEPDGKQTEDRFLGMLQHQGSDVHRETERILTKNRKNGELPKPTPLHFALLRLFPSVERIRIVTTNFDKLFEEAAREIFGAEIPERSRYDAPVLPRGKDCYGIIHLHGIVGHPEEMILTDADFGRAYYGEGWARRFLIDLLQHQSVLYIGYSHNDAALYYITRSFTENDEAHPMQLRWALIPENSEPIIRDHWKMLGIQEIAYPFPVSGDNPYSALSDGINELAKHATFALERWKDTLHNLASRKPSELSEEELDLTVWALCDAPDKEGEELTLYFTEKACDPEWVEWLDELPTGKSSEKLLAPLFTNGELDPRRRILSEWLAASYAENFSDVLIFVISKHSLDLNPLFFSDLLRSIYIRNIEIKPEAIKQWTFIFIKNIVDNKHYDKIFFFKTIVTKCLNHNLWDCVLDVFETLCKERISIERQYGLMDKHVSPRILNGIRVDLNLIGDHWTLMELWDGRNSELSLKGHLDKLADALLTRMIRKLEERHRLWITWNRADRNQDPDSWSRNAIEPHEQDAHFRREMNIIIDAARDCLEWTATNRPSEAAAWIDRLARSESPLIRRLALHAFAQCQKSPANLKIDWFLARFSPLDWAEHHEIYQFLGGIYPDLDEENRKKVILAIKDCKFECADVNESEKLTENSQYKLLDWLKQASKASNGNCRLVDEAIDVIKRRHSQWTSTEHPDFLSYSTGLRYIKYISPYSSDELLAKPPDKWLPDLLSFRPEDEISNINRQGMCDELSVAVRRNFDWGLSLASALIEQNLWATDLWHGLFHAWGWHEDASLDSGQFAKILNVIENKALWLPVHLHALSSILYSLVRNHVKPYALELASRTHVIARGLWSALDRNQADPSHDNWVSTAINSDAGVLAKYWIGNLSLWIQSQDPRPREISGEYRVALTVIADAATINGRLGRTILAARYNWFYYLDDQWTRDHLSLYFSPCENPSDFISVWHGFLASDQLDMDTFSSLEEKFLDAIPQIHNGGHLSEKRDRFIEFAAAAICFYVTENPLSRWTPRLIKELDDAGRAKFAQYVSKQILSFDDVQQRDCWARWLKPYWEKRINAIPPPAIGNQEATSLLTLLVWLPAVFDEAVEIAIRMTGAHPSFEIMFSDFIHFSSRFNKDFVQAHGAAFKKLMDYRTHSNPNEYCIYKNELLKIKVWINQSGSSQEALKGVFQFP